MRGKGLSRTSFPPASFAFIFCWRRYRTSLILNVADKCWGARKQPRLENGNKSAGTFKSFCRGGIGRLQASKIAEVDLDVIPVLR